VTVRVRPTTVTPEPNPAASLNIVAKTPYEWIMSLSRAMDSAEKSTPGLNNYLYYFQAPSANQLTLKDQTDLDNQLYEVLAGLLGPPEGQVPWFYLWSVFISRRSWKIRNAMNPFVIDCLLTNGWIGPAYWSDDQLPLATSVARAVEQKAIEGGMWRSAPKNVAAFTAKYAKGATFNILKPGSYIAHPHGNPPTVFRGYPEILEAARPRRGSMTVPNVWYKTLAELFEGAWSLANQILYEQDALDIFPLFSTNRATYLDNAVRLQLFDLIFGPPNLAIPQDVILFLGNDDDSGRQLRTYLVYRHHLKLVPGEPAPEPTPDNFALLMGTSPVPA